MGSTGEKDLIEYRIMREEERHAREAVHKAILLNMSISDAWFISKPGKLPILTMKECESISDDYPVSIQKLWEIFTE